MTGNYVSKLFLKIDGAAASTELMNDVLQAFVEESLHQPGMFMIVIRNNYESGIIDDQPWKYASQFKIGKTIEIGFRSSTNSSDFNTEKERYLLKGEVTAIETHFTERTQAPVIVRGYDVSHRLFRGRHNRSFQNMTDKDIVNKVIKEAGINPGTIDSSGVVHDYVFQANQTNMEFLRERSARIGFELFVQDGNLNFRKPKADSSQSLEWLKDLQSFRVRLTSAEQVKEVEVRGWDYTTKRPILAKAQAEQRITDTQDGKGSSTSTAFNGQPANPKMIVVDQPVFQPKEADAIAQALCNELGGQYVQADAKAEGNPELRPGRTVELKGLGSHSGKYYVSETRHVFVKEVYTTEFSIRGMHAGNLLNAIAPSPKSSPGQSFLVGIVTDNEDPQGWGRVKVKFPTLTEDHASNWARVVAIGAGNQRGFDCLPEINDEVLVAFEHGDIHRPYVIGNVWNGEDAPPNPVRDNVQGGKVRLRTFKTRTGHQIQFIEEAQGASQKGVQIETTNGHQIYLNDSDGSISIRSTGNLTIEAKGNINISANGMITIQGSMIKLN